MSEKQIVTQQMIDWIKEWLEKSRGRDYYVFGKRINGIAIKDNCEEYCWFCEKLFGINVHGYGKSPNCPCFQLSSKVVNAVASDIIANPELYLTPEPESETKGDFQLLAELLEIPYYDNASEIKDYPCIYKNIFLLSHLSYDQFDLEKILLPIQQEYKYSSQETIPEKLAYWLVRILNIAGYYVQEYTKYYCFIDDRYKQEPENKEEFDGEASSTISVYESEQNKNRAFSKAIIKLAREKAKNDSES